MKMLRLLGYVFFFLISFIFLTYWMFPYDSLKERLVTLIEQQMGSQVEVSLESLKPSFITGIKLKKLKMYFNDGSNKFEVMNIPQASARLSLLSTLFASPHFTFSVELGGGEIDGDATLAGSTIDLDLDFDAVNISAIKVLASRYGLQLGSSIDGNISLKVDQQRWIRSTGSVDLDFRSLELKESEFKLDEGGIPLPAVVFAKGRASGLKAKIVRGSLNVEKFLFEGGDLGLDLKGRVGFGDSVESTRFDLDGMFNPSTKLSDALPFLFIVQKQKRPDGSYPLSISGRGARPSIKIGTFSVAL